MQDLTVAAAPRWVETDVAHLHDAPR